jgi:membrane protein
MKPRSFFSNSWGLLKETFAQFKSDRVLKLSAALAYYTVFSLPALFLILISVSGLVFGDEASAGVVYNQLNELIGNKAAAEIQSGIAQMHVSGKSYIGTIIGIITLLLSAGGIFGEIQDSINLIWGLKAKPRRGFIKLIINRIISFSLVISLGFILLVTLIINGLLAALRYKLEAIFPELSVQIIFLVDYAMQVITITFLFAVIFKVLPDAKIKWRDVIKGAVFTTILFIIGKIVISYLISRNSVSEIYGAAGSVLILLLWVYYSSAILYIGAEFTQVYAMRFGSRIVPNKYAVWTNEEKEQIKFSDMDVKLRSAGKKNRHTKTVDDQKK